VGYLDKKIEEIERGTIAREVYGYKYRWGKKYFKSEEALERAIKGLEKARELSRKYAGVKGFALVKTKDGEIRVMLLKNALMAKEAGTVTEILAEAPNIKELKRKIGLW